MYKLRKFYGKKVWIQRIPSENPHEWVVQFSRREWDPIPQVLLGDQGGRPTDSTWMHPPSVPSVEWLGPNPVIIIPPMRYALTPPNSEQTRVEDIYTGCPFWMEPGSHIEFCWEWVKFWETQVHYWRMKMEIYPGLVVMYRGGHMDKQVAVSGIGEGRCRKMALAWGWPSSVHRRY